MCTLVFTCSILLSAHRNESGVLSAGQSISDGYKFPRKQGIDDLRYLSKAGTLTATYVRPANPCAFLPSSLAC